MISNQTISGELLDESVELNLDEISRACRVHSSWIISLVNEAIIEPTGEDVSNWQFSGACMRRIRCVQRLETDLGVNLAGAAVIVELVEELKILRGRLHNWDV